MGNSSSVTMSSKPAKVARITDIVYTKYLILISGLIPYSGRFKMSKQV